MLDIISCDDYNGQRIDILADVLSGHSGPSLLNFKRYKPRVCEYIRDRILNKTGIFVDIGAHFGYFSCLAARWMFSGSVHAFEPNDLSYLMLRKNILDAAGTKVYPRSYKLVASDRYDTFDIEKDYLSNEGSKFQPSKLGKYRSCRVGGEINDILKMSDKQRVLCVKVDVNGMEVEALRGLESKIDITDCVVVKNNGAEFFEHEVREIFGYDKFSYRALDNQHVVLERNVE